MAMSDLFSNQDGHDNPKEVYRTMISSLAGMFSKQAIDKLVRIFKIIFKSKEAVERDLKDSLKKYDLVDH